MEDKVIKKISTTLVISLIFLFIITGMAVAAPKGPKEIKDSKGPAGKINICHREGNGSYHLINISENAKESHINHGDAFPGDAVEGGTLGADCSLSAETLTISSLWTIPGKGAATEIPAIDPPWNSPECIAVIDSFKTAFYYPLMNNTIIFGLDASAIPADVLQLPFNVIETPVLVGAALEGVWAVSGVVNCEGGVCLSTPIGKYSSGTPTNFTGTLEFIFPNGICRQTFENNSFVALMNGCLNCQK